MFLGELRLFGEEIVEQARDHFRDDYRVDVFGVLHLQAQRLAHQRVAGGVEDDIRVVAEFDHLEGMFDHRHAAVLEAERHRRLGIAVGGRDDLDGEFAFLNLGQQPLGKQFADLSQPQQCDANLAVRHHGVPLYLVIGLRYNRRAWRSSIAGKTCRRQWRWDWKFVEKVPPWTFSTRKAKNVVFALLHFQTLGVLENAGTSVCRASSLLKNGAFQQTASPAAGN